MILLAAQAQPSAYWFATRGLGVASLVLLTGTVVLGIGTVGRWREQETPGFVVANLHRNLSLLAVLTVILHVTTTLLDPFAHITIRDALIPVDAAYRPVWLGLGVVAFEILIAVSATSLLRGRIGVKAWRRIHWAAYASWPIALVHGLGTGSDAQAPWMIGITAACIVAVLVTLARRLASAANLGISSVAAAAAGALVYFGITWYVAGPLQSDWVVRAGTPVPSPTQGPVHPGSGGFSDYLIGVMVRDANGNVQMSFRDTIDPQLTIMVRSANTAANESMPVITIQRKGRQLCSVPASVDQSMYAVCGTTRFTITLYQPVSTAVGTSDVSAQLTTSGSLN